MESNSDRFIFESSSVSDTSFINCEIVIIMGDAHTCFFENCGTVVIFGQVESSIFNTIKNLCLESKAIGSVVLNTHYIKMEELNSNTFIWKEESIY
jgi:hypothetical protein